MDSITKEKNNAVMIEMCIYANQLGRDTTYIFSSFERQPCLNFSIGDILVHFFVVLVLVKDGEVILRIFVVFIVFHCVQKLL